MKDYYLILGIDRNASMEGIKQAYRRSVKKYHPDLTDTNQHLEQFRDATEAYETLCHEGRRREYDHKLKKEEGQPVSRAPRKPESLRFHQKNHVPWQIDPQDLFRSVLLTPDQQRRGTSVEHSILIQRPCSHCSDFFLGAVISCPYCQGTRRLRSKKELIINIPAGIDDGTLVRLPLDHVGLTNMKLTVRISVQN